MYELLAILLALLLVIYSYYQWRFQYWKHRNLHHLPGYIPFGSIENPITRKIPYYIRLKEFYDASKAAGHKHAGIYLMTNARYMAIHPDYIKNIMSSDFNHFTGRGMFINERDDPLSNNLFSMEGDKWRKLRPKVTPALTSGKIKGMLETLLNCIEPLKTALDEHTARNEPIDIKEISGCFTIDVIGSVAFGLECNSFKSPDAPFRRLGMQIFELKLLDVLKFLFWRSFPSIAEFLRFTTTSKDLRDFFMGTVVNTVAYRQANNVSRNDYMQILIGLKNDVAEEDAITVTEIAAQAFVFFAAGFDTSSTTIQFGLFELALNQTIQTRVRDEILNVFKKHGGVFTYEALQEMNYLNMVIEEVLRKYPPLPVLYRICTQEYKVPDTDIIIPKNMMVINPVYALHHDAEYFPEPNKFDPERFSEENKQHMKPFTYMPFGAGPRTCIAKRFAMIEIKVCLASIIQNYVVKLNNKTILPFEPDCNDGFIIRSKHKILLDMEKL